MTTVLVPLTQGKFATIDAEDWPRVSQSKWHAVRNASGIWYAYATVRPGTIRSRSIAMHRLLMGNPEGLLIDHINGDGLDNRRENLRIGTKLLNGGNCGMRSHNTSGYKGVSFDKARNAWKAQIGNKATHRFLGRFATAEAAARAYDEAARARYGEFAHCNFP